MPKPKRISVSLATSAYEAIRQDILEGQFEPGQKLQFEILRQQYGIGISPLREALGRLQSEGWVDREEQRGFRVAGISKEELLDVVRTRIMLEALGVAEALSLRDASAEEAVVLALHRLGKEPRLLDAHTRNPEWEKRHRELHRALVAGSRMKWLMQFWEQLFDVAERYRLLSAAGNPERSEKNEHHAIVEAYLAGDAAKVKQLLAAHYQVTVDYILRTRFPHGPSPDDATSHRDVR
jgi:DNA-binding GntR family transcriptional regulator